MNKYPELLEFPNGVQNLMTLFFTEIQYDVELVKHICNTLASNFNIIMAKDQFIQKMSDENEEPYVEYLQPVFMVLISLLKLALKPQSSSSSSTSTSTCSDLISTCKRFFHRVTTVALYITGSKIDQIMRLFYLFFARIKVEMMPIEGEDQEKGQKIEGYDEGAAGLAPEEPEVDDDDVESS